MKLSTSTVLASVALSLSLFTPIALAKPQIGYNHSPVIINNLKYERDLIESILKEQLKDRGSSCQTVTLDEKYLKRPDLAITSSCNITISTSLQEKIKNYVTNPFFPKEIQRNVKFKILETVVSHELYHLSYYVGNSAEVLGLTHRVLEEGCATSNSISFPSEYPVFFIQIYLKFQDFVERLPGFDCNEYRKVREDRIAFYLLIKKVFPNLTRDTIKKITVKMWDEDIFTDEVLAEIKEYIIYLK